MSYGFGLLNDYAHRVHQTAIDKGFWDSVDVSEGSDCLAKLMLVVTEVAEAAEAVRKGDDENFAEELADICIRVFDLAEGSGVNLEQAIVDKMQKNESRPHMHGKRA